MRNFRNVLFVSLLSFLIIGPTHAQIKSSPAADADKAFNTFQYTVAADLYKKAYSKVKRNPVEKRRIMFQMAECYTLTGNLKLAEKQYLRLEKVNYQKDNPLIFLRLGDIYRLRKDFAKALEYYKKYKKYNPDDPRCDDRIESATLAPEWINNPTRDEVENMKRFNSPQNEWSPAWGLPKKENQIVFTSSREGNSKKTDVWTGESFSDLYVSNKPKSKLTEFPGEWTTPTLLDNSGMINSESNEGEATFNPKGTTIYFSRCLDEKKTLSYCKIYQATKKGKSWAEPENIILGPDSFDYVHPCISADELTLYFVSDMTGTNGGYDIWKATRPKKNKPFDKPENLGSVVNSYDHEMYPSLENDSTLYFASKGHVNLGGFDIFVSHLENGEWSKPENMKYPINSEADDYGIIFEHSPAIDPVSGFAYLRKGYFTSNREGGRGGDDIWSFKLRPLIFTLAGFVKDSVTLQYIDGASVTVTGSDGSELKTTTDIRGYYSFDKTKILPEVTYEIHIKKSGYYENDNCDGRETTVGLQENKDLKHNFVINPIPKEPVLMPEILYDLGKWNLKPQYQDSLMGLYKIMKENPTFVIELRSHTDCRPIPMTNDTLSQRRAESCVNFLIDSMHIDPARLVAKGYAERVPRTLEKNITSRGYVFEKGTVLTKEYIESLSPKNKQEAAHDLNRRTEFMILRDDYVPSNDTVFAVDPTQPRVSIITQKFIKISTENEGQIVRGDCYVNSKTLKFRIEPETEQFTMSYEQAMNFLKAHIITVADFEKGAGAIVPETGNIIDGSVVYMETLQIGDDILENVAFTVVKDQKDPIVIGSKTFIDEFGSYNINVSEQKLIFD